MEKVYGICENKCLKEVLTKDDVYTKDDLLVFSGSFSLDSKKYKGVIITQEELGETLESFDPADWIVVCAMDKIGSDPWKLPHFVSGAVDDTSPNVSFQQFPYQEYAVTIKVYNYTPYTQTCWYKIALMKVA